MRISGRIEVELASGGTVDLEVRRAEPGDLLIAELFDRLADELRPAAAVLELDAGDVAELVAGDAACRVCGCTDEQACEPSCWWVTDPAGEGMLCSACLATMEAIDEAHLEAMAPPAAPLPFHPAAGSTRDLIIQALRDNGGEIVDDDGMATRRLMELSGLVNAGSVSQILLCMERDRQIVRDKPNARRVTRIALVAPLAAVPDLEPEPARVYGEPPDDETIARRRAAATEAMYES